MLFLFPLVEPFEREVLRGAETHIILQRLAPLAAVVVHEEDEEFQAVPVALDIGIVALLGDDRRGPALRLDDRLDRLRIRRVDKFGVRRSRREKRQRGEGEGGRSEEHTSKLQSLMRISYAVFCLKTKKKKTTKTLRA